MMRLKHLFNNQDLAEMLLKYWQYDDDYSDMFKYFRISSNAIYPFKINGELNFLRISPIEEKSKEIVMAELDFIFYLISEGFGVLEPVSSRDGRFLMETSTPWGNYLAVVFKEVEGIQLDRTDFNNDIITAYGKTLGDLHRLSAGYSSDVHKRLSYKDALQWTGKILNEISDDAVIRGKALKELELLEEYFSKIPVDDGNFGLVHYDFEYDNVFYNQDSGRCNVIDFDDSMYHWYLMDIVKALDSMNEHISVGDYQDKQELFINAYRSKYNVSDDMLSMIPGFRRFENLYSYARIMYSIEESWENEPEWMINLRKHLSSLLNEKSICFGNPLKTI